jgi:hypothetical protein
VGAASAVWAYKNTGEERGEPLLALLVRPEQPRPKMQVEVAAHEKEEDSDDDFKVGKSHRSARGHKCRRVGVHAHKQSVKE